MKNVTGGKESSELSKMRIAVDVQADGLNFKLQMSPFSVPFVPQIFPSVPCALSSNTKGYQHLSGPTLACLDTLLCASQSLAKENETVLLLGSEFDPFSPFESCFIPTVSVLKRLVSSQLSHIFIQTRSPLILTALPLLKALTHKLTVIFPIETASDSWSRRALASCANPSERFACAQILTSRDIDTRLHVTPLIPRNSARKGVSALALAMSRTGCSSEILSREESFAASDIAALCSHKGLLETADLLLYRELRSCYPGHLTRHPSRGEDGEMAVA